MILIFMIFLHIVDDYYLQGWLASAKQKKYWVEQDGYNKKYRYDYVWALLMHSFSWSFMIMLPIFIYYDFKITFLCILFFILNILIHAFTDNMKANMLKINLIEDQIIHMFQILITYLFLI